MPLYLDTKIKTTLATRAMRAIAVAESLAKTRFRLSTCFPHSKNIYSYIPPIAPIILRQPKFSSLTVTDVIRALQLEAWKSSAHVQERLSGRHIEQQRRGGIEQSSYSLLSSSLYTLGLNCSSCLGLFCLWWEGIII